MNRLLLQNLSQINCPQSPSKKTPFDSLFATLLALLILVALACFAIWYFCFRMPGVSYQGDDRDQDSSETAVQQQDDSESEESEQKTTVEQLTAHVVHLAETIGERNLGHLDELNEAADYIETKFTEFGYTPARHAYEVRGVECFNIEAEIKGSAKPEDIVIIGAHYDSAQGTPGANDNGSGTAAMLTLANHFREATPEFTLRFVAFTNEEPPYFQNRGQMGSWVYAEKCRAEDQNILAVISLETMGYFSDEEGSQKYPAPLNLMYPSTGNFIGFVSNMNSARLQRRIIKVFREHAKVPSEAASLPEATPGVGWSDHWSFWQEGYVGIMVTDTAPFRYPPLS